MGWGTEEVVGVGAQEEGEVAVAVEATAGEEQNEKVQLAAALGCVLEMPPLVVKEGGFAFPLCPSGQHGLKVVDAFMEPQVYCLLKVIDKANITKSGDGPMNLELSDEFLHRAVTLVQGGKLPPGGCLAVWVCEHPVKLYHELCPHS